MYRISLTIAHTLQYYILLAGNWQNIAKSVGKDMADFSLLTYKWFVVLSPEICLLKEKWLHTQLLYTGFRILKLVICSHIIIIASWSQRLMHCSWMLDESSQDSCNNWFTTCKLLEWAFLFLINISAGD